MIHLLSAIWTGSEKKWKQRPQGAQSSTVRLDEQQ